MPRHNSQYRKGFDRLERLLVGSCIPGKPVCPATAAEISHHLKTLFGN